MLTFRSLVLDSGGVGVGRVDGSEWIEVGLGVVGRWKVGERGLVTSKDLPEQYLIMYSWIFHSPPDHTLP